MNILDYVQMRGDVTFAKSPFNEVDAAVLGVFASVNLDEITAGKPTISDLVTRYMNAKNEKDMRDGRLDEKENLIQMMSTSPRYAKIRLLSFEKVIDREKEMTFYAAQFQINPFRRLVTFRGTDGYLISWKENFNTLYQFPTPGQNQAVKYIDGIKLKFWEKLILSGHSKGGNLACYSGAFCNESIYNKIEKIYIFDGPGFERDLSDDLRMKNIIPKICSFIPESSLIGRLMYVPYESKVVKSEGNGIYQHDIYNWHVGPCGFVQTSGVDGFSDGISTKVNDWIAGIPEDRRAEVVSELFAVFEKVGIDHADKFTNLNIKTLISLLMGVRSLSSESIKLLIIIIKEVKAAH
ncbi:MAG: DUF2974 domain-containing protein [Lachnospiraceae bacterium]|nr:DUF2974 domain-containing protein [Lachnospiraceae bacterium]